MGTPGVYELRPRDLIPKRNLRNSSYKMQILDKIINSPNGITADELEIRLKLRSSTISSALNAMKASKMIVDTGERRNTRSGRSAIVYARRHKRG